jgi:hypothetical protein
MLELACFYAVQPSFCNSFSSMVGMGLWAFYQVHPPETELANDRVFADFIIHEMPIGARGLTLWPF